MMEKIIIFSLAFLGAGGFLLSRHIKSQPVAPLPSSQPGSNASASAGGGAPVSASDNAPRGIRNNNPGNIKWSALNNWVGQIGKDAGGFIVFDKPENGIRAMQRLLNNYASQGFDTIEKIIKKWTSGDSPVIQQQYIIYVANRLGVSQSLVLNPNLHRVALIKAIIQFENGGAQPYGNDLISRGMAAA